MEPIFLLTIKAVDSSLSGILSILAEESGYNIVTGPTDALSPPNFNIPPLS